MDSLVDDLAVFVAGIPAARPALAFPDQLLDRKEQDHCEAGSCLSWTVLQGMVVVVLKLD